MNYRSSSVLDPITYKWSNKLNAHRKPHAKPCIYTNIGSNLSIFPAMDVEYHPPNTQTSSNHRNPFISLIFSLQCIKNCICCQTSADHTANQRERVHACFAKGLAKGLAKAMSKSLPKSLPKSLQKSLQKACHLPCNSTSQNF